MEILDKVNKLEDELKKMSYVAYQTKENYWKDTVQTRFYSEFIDDYKPKTNRFIYEFKDLYEAIERAKRDVESILNE